MTATKKISYESIKEFFEANVKGHSYTGDFRPDHRVFVYEEDGEIIIFDKYEASGNYSFQDISPVQIFKNGFEGRFDLEGAVWDCVQEENDTYVKPYISGLPAKWDEMDEEEKVNWLMENKVEECEDMHENTWDEQLENLMNEAERILEEEGWEIEY